MGKNVTEDGFTIVEVIVALFIAAIFVSVVIQMTHFSGVQHQATITRTAAMNVANSNINKFPSKEAVLSSTIAKLPTPVTHAPFFCKPGASWGSLDVPDSYTNQPDINLAANANAPGITLIDNSSTNKETAPESLINPIQRVALYAPDGCEAATFTDPLSTNIATIKIESTVEYGPPGNRNTVRISSHVF